MARLNVSHWEAAKKRAKKVESLLVIVLEEAETGYHASAESGVVNPTR